MKPLLTLGWVNKQLLHTISLRIFTHMELCWFTALAISLLNPVLGPDPWERSDFSCSASPFTQIAGGKPQCGRAAACSGQRCIETNSRSRIGEFSQDWQFGSFPYFDQKLGFLHFYPGRAAYQYWLHATADAHVSLSAREVYVPPWRALKATRVCLLLLPSVWPHLDSPGGPCK